MCNNCINAQLQAENAELKLQVTALTQALETQKRENQPYIKELETSLERAKKLLNRANSVSLPECLQDDIEQFIISLTTAGGVNPESE
jgi:hypothetical protein